VASDGPVASRISKANERLERFDNCFKRVADILYNSRGLLRPRSDKDPHQRGAVALFLNLIFVFCTRARGERGLIVLSSVFAP